MHLLRENIGVFNERIKILIIISSFIFYTILFFLLLPFTGEKASVLSLLPIITLSYFAGFKIGLITAFILIPINTLFLQISGYPFSSVILSNIPGILGTFVISAVVGVTSDLYKKSKYHLNELLENKKTLEKEINERIKTEKALQESEIKYRQLVDSVKEVIFQTDSNGNWIFLSKVWEEISGFSINECLNKNFLSFIYPEDRSTVEKKIILLLRSDKNIKIFETRYSTKRGEKRWARISLHPNFNNSGKIINISGTISDITAQKINEEKINIRDKALNAVLNGIVITNPNLPDNPIIYTNPAFEQITGYKFSEVKGKNCRLLHGKKTSQDEIRKIKEAIRSKKECKVILLNYKKDGSPFWNELSISPIKDSAGIVTYFVGILSDVTERITERIKADEDIKQTLEKERELNELKSKFVSTISHEFRTPLTSILASSELMQRYFYKWDDEKKLNNLKRIEKSVEYMNEMINDVLTLNRAESGRIDFKPEIIDLVELSANILEEIKLAALPSHNFIFNYNEECKNVFADEKLLRNIISNLLTNSVKYSPKGGNIYFSLNKVSDEVELSVKDEGLGIPEEDQKQLFQPFFRGSNINNIPGSGLGLSILQRAVHLHKGKISFESKLENGTNFIIKIPVKI